MKCFITGATGFIGSAVTERLLEKNHEVTGLTHSPEKTEALCKKGVLPVVGDMREPEQWISSVHDAEAIIHTATLPVLSRPNKRYLNNLRQAQETAVSSLIVAARSCRLFIYTSGMTVYGTGKATKTEQSEIDPVELARPYVVGERLLMEAYEKNEFPVMILRPAGVYGDGGIFAKYWTKPISKGKRAPYPGNGKQVKSWLMLFGEPPNCGWLPIGGNILLKPLNYTFKNLITMPKVKIKKHIKAPQKQVWEFISDIEKAPEWVVVMRSLEETTENPVREGTVYRESSKIGPKESETEWKVTYFDPPHKQVHECEEPDFKASLTMRVGDNGDGTSTLFHTTEYQLLPKFRPLGWLVETLFIKKMMDKNLHQSVDNCKQLIEEEI